MLAGGLGNQLFTYAAAYRLAKVNKAELVIDDSSGFENDHTYKRKYELDQFKISARKAGFFEKLRPFNRITRRLIRKVNSYLPFDNRFYVAQETIHFDNRLLELRFKKTLFLEGLWQSESYFADVADEIRGLFTFRNTANFGPSDLLQIIEKTQSVAIHFRFFESDTSVDGSAYNVDNNYYWRAINLVLSKLPDAHFFLFSDRADLFKKKFDAENLKITIVSDANTPDATAHNDFYLMSRCKHFILANSTFGWWAAWLATNTEKIITVPNVYSDTGTCGWGFEGLIPDQWIKL
jgi:hypothetical protein